MNQNSPAGNVPESLAAYLTGGASRTFRRRAVLTNENNQWRVICCTIEAFLPGERVPKSRPSRIYPKAVLFEDLLTGAECLAFATELGAGQVCIDRFSPPRGLHPQWSIDFAPVENIFMVRAGLVVGARLNYSSTPVSGETLVAPGQPYYPEVFEAARDWLPFPKYHGRSDGRHDQIFFLLPESRAFVSTAVFSQSRALDITVAGTEVDKVELRILGAYWEEESIFHFDVPVRNSKAALTVPADADRLEYVLIDGTGTVFDFHREDRFSGLTVGRHVLGSVQRDVVAQVHKASCDGEGVHVEFKPFVDPDQKLMVNNEKTKLLEVVRTVVAFANAGGGHIYLGIDDECTVTGLNQQLLSKWAQAPINSSTIDRYLGALKSKIKDLVRGEVELNLSHVQIGDALVVVIEVPPSTSKPVSVEQENYCLYTRNGASNRKVSVDQWASALNIMPAFQSG